MASLKFIFWAINPAINPQSKSPVPAVAREFDLQLLIQISPFGKERTVSLPFNKTQLDMLVINERSVHKMGR